MPNFIREGRIKKVGRERISPLEKGENKSKKKTKGKGILTYSEGERGDLDPCLTPLLVTWKKRFFTLIGVLSKMISSHAS